MDSKIWRSILIWKSSVIESWNWDFPIPEYHKFLFALPLFLNFFFTFVFISSCVLIKWVLYHTSLFLFVCYPNLMTWGTGKHLTCKNISTADGFSVGKKRTKGRVTRSLPTQASGSLHPGRKEHVVSGNTLEQSFLIYSLSNKGPTFLQEPEGQDGLADVRSVSWPQRKFIHAFIHSFPKV